MSISYLIIDWGTTNFRAFALNEKDQVQQQTSLPLGLLQVPNGEFAHALEQVLENWLGEYQHLPIYMAGMVGSMKGWVNVDYVATPASAESIADKVYGFSLPWGSQGYIFPGLSHKTGENYDVMRGEEVQLLGASIMVSSNDLTAILPGTHSKHATITETRVANFTSYLTGEVFSVLTEHSLLGKGLIKQDTFDKESFLNGVEDSKNGVLTNRVFLGWTKRLFGQMNEAQIPDYLSGMLIGFELQSCLDSFYYIIGGESLSHRYQIALNHLSINSEIISGDDCFLAGMIALKDEIS